MRFGWLARTALFFGGDLSRCKKLTTERTEFHRGSATEKFPTERKNARIMTAFLCGFSLCSSVSSVVKAFELVGCIF
jgi:hypothetical protein